jgi:hypothetical protein
LRAVIKEVIMVGRLLGAMAVAFSVAALASGTVSGQSARGTWTPPRSPDGKPDLQGYWTNATLTPLERPAELAGKEFLTEAEAAAYEQKRLQQENSQSKDDIHYDNVIWQTENYAKGVSRRRSSIIYEPADGKIPPLTPAAQALATARAAAARAAGPADSADSRSLGERCISWGNEGPPMLGATYQANLQIVQVPGHVVIRHELMHGVRVIPMDGRPHVGAQIRLLGGDSRGRWEGDTLVVDTTNFSDRTNFRGPPATTRPGIFASKDLHVVERFTRVDSDSILYRFTLEDPSTWTRPWSGEILMRKMEGPLFEYACHEGNYGLQFILSAARAQEKTGTDTQTR